MDFDKMPMESVNVLGVHISHLFIDFITSMWERSVQCLEQLGSGIHMQQGFYNTHAKEKKEKRNKTAINPMRSNGQNSCCIISETSDVEGRWHALNIVLDEKVLFLTLLNSSQQHCHIPSLQKSRCSQVWV